VKGTRQQLFSNTRARGKIFSGSAVDAARGAMQSLSRRFKSNFLLK
jgi:hypothetical protein